MNFISLKFRNSNFIVLMKFHTQGIQIMQSLKINSILLFCLISLNASLFANDLVRPCIWVTPSDRQDILAKIETEEWAGTIYTGFIDQLNKDIELYQANPEEFLKQMPFDWEKSKPGETPPFTYTTHVVNGKRTNLDNGTPEEMANARKLIRFLEIGVDCGMAYYITEDERYAQCATDILNAFIKGVRQMEQSEWRGRGGWLFPDDGFREVRVIGSKVPLIYDFIAGFIRNGGQAYDLGKKALIVFPQAEAQMVFRTYANFTIYYGMTGSNHPILEAPSLVYNALAMEDENERNELLSYFLTENTENQDALNVMAGIYQEEGDIWPETSQYLNAAGSILTRLMLIVNRYDPSLRLGEKYSNVLFSLPALDYLVYPNNQIIRWGDGHRYGSPSYTSYEDAYLLGKMDGVEKITNTFGTLLNSAMEQGKYRRTEMYAVLTHGGDIIGETGSLILPRTDKVVHAGIFLQRNLSSTRDPDDGLMCFVGGAHMVHGHAEGMNIELYGEGQVLGVDNGRGRYQQDIHENYSRIFAAHNTVIVNGSSRGDSGWVNQGINTVKLISMEPMPGKEAISPYHSYSQTSFVDDRGDKAEATQERTLALIRTSPTTGYYVDVFRSKSKLPNEYHDYLYHNPGDRLAFHNEDLKYAGTPERYMANAAIPWEQNKQYRHPGWHFFEDVQTVSQYNKDVKAQFTVEKLEDKMIYMNLYVPGCENRDYTKVMAPPTFEAPKPYDGLATPTLVIRKNGEAWNYPFVVVYEPFSEIEKDPSIQCVEKLEQDGLYKGLKIVSKIGSNRFIQYVITQSPNEVFDDENLKIHFKGTFAVITLDENERLQNMYIGEGEDLRFGETVLKTDRGKRAAYKEIL
jgi:hypothetical protein